MSSPFPWDSPPLFSSPRVACTRSSNPRGDKRPPAGDSRRRLSVFPEREKSSPPAHSFELLFFLNYVQEHLVDYHLVLSRFVQLRHDRATDVMRHNSQRHTHFRAAAHDVPLAAKQPAILFHVVEYGLLRAQQLCRNWHLPPRHL